MLTSRQFVGAVSRAITDVSGELRCRYAVRFSLIEIWPDVAPGPPRVPRFTTCASRRRAEQRHSAFACDRRKR